jgi:hypothetical protein
MKIPWRISDLIDLEYFLHTDANRDDPYDPESRHRRDRAIYRQTILPVLNSTDSASRRTLLKLWLDHRRMAAAEDPDDQMVLPGAVFSEVFKLMGYGAAVAGSCTGFALATSLLGYSGTRPVNVSVFFSLLVLLQVMAIVFSMGMFALHGFKADTCRKSMVYTLLGRLLTKLIQRVTNRVKNRVPAGRRDSIQAAAGLVMGKGRIYGSLFFWPLFIITQIFAVSINGGVLTGTLLRVLTTDLAFGWQSTLRLGAQGVYLMVKAISWPWSFLLPAGMAHPSLSQIEGSRMVLKEGIYQLTTPALVSWWPFLCMAIVFYALLPRLMLLFVGRLAQRRALARIRFTHASCDQLIHRMETPVLKTGAIEPEHPKNSDGERSLGLNTPKPSFARADQTTQNVMALVPEEIIDQGNRAQLPSDIKAFTGFNVLAVIPTAFHPQELDMLANRIHSPKAADTELPAIFILQEAWQPPIRETIWFIRQIRKILGPKPSIFIGLVGKPGPDTLFTPVKKENRRVWEHKITAMGDPYLQVQPLGGSHD